jgi:hypothetical protein
LRHLEQELGALSKLGVAAYDGSGEQVSQQWLGTTWVVNDFVLYRRNTWSAPSRSVSVSIR